MEIKEIQEKCKAIAEKIDAEQANVNYYKDKPGAVLSDFFNVIFDLQKEQAEINAAILDHLEMKK